MLLFSFFFISFYTPTLSLTLHITDTCCLYFTMCIIFCSALLCWPEPAPTTTNETMTMTNDFYFGNNKFGTIKYETTFNRPDNHMFNLDGLFAEPLLREQLTIQLIIICFRGLKISFWGCFHCSFCLSVLTKCINNFKLNRGEINFKQFA